MAIAYIDAPRVQKAVIAAAHRVVEIQERLNHINVFPVPDGDTGTNMALTLRSIANGAANAGKDSLDQLGQVLAETALVGARGNSGAVLAQFFQGMARAFRGEKRMSIQAFSQAMHLAVGSAQQAFSHPVDGTILSVMRAWGEALQQRAPTAGDIASLWNEALAIARQALQDTPKQLEVLAKAGVVDAGAKGFVAMLEGVATLMESGELASVSEGVPFEAPASLDVATVAVDWNYPFCTECLVSGEELDLVDIRKKLEEMGNSLVVAGSSEKARIHIHTAKPQEVFSLAEAWGEVSHRKAEDMRLQAADKAAQQNAGYALITDSSCDLPPEYFIQHQIRVVPLNLHIGTQTYLDRITITSEALYSRMAEQGVKCQTSQPAPAAFRQAFALASEQHQEGIALLLTQALSGTFQAGVLAASQESRIQVTCWDSRKIAAGLGFLVELAVESNAQGCSKQEIIRRLEIARPHVHIAVSLSTMKYLRRSGRIGRVRGWLATLLNLVPIIGLDPAGYVKVLGKARPGEKSRDKIFNMVTKATAGLEDVRLRIIHAGAVEAARQLAQRFEAHFQQGPLDVLPVSPILGSHFGPGTVAVAWVAYPPGVKTW